MAARRVSAFFGRNSNSSVNSIEGVSPEVVPGQHRASGEFRRGSKQKAKAGIVVAPAELSMSIESPPLVAYGTPDSSTGALMSAIIRLDIHPEQIQVDAFEMVLQAVTTTKKPVKEGCNDCITKVSELYIWHFVAESEPMKKGEHAYPFSYLFPGHLPASTTTSLGSISYQLVAKVVSPSIPATAPLILKKIIKLERSIIPGPDRRSMRVFPPTNLQASVVLPNVIHPIGEFPVLMKITGVCNPASESRWRLRKFNWRLDEQLKSISPACPRHSKIVGGEGKGISHEETRTVGYREVKSGWKSDYSMEGGEVEMEFMAAIRNNSKAACDVVSPDGVEVHHTLVVELIVAEEHVPKSNPRMVTATGAARVLRMNFKLILTERMGMGISWDMENPPLYEDVPASPPNYGRMEIDNYDGELSDGSMEDLSLDRTSIEGTAPKDLPPPFSETDQNPFDAQAEGSGARERMRGITVADLEYDHPTGVGALSVSSAADDEREDSPPRVGEVA
jgi:arrestin-related trafficking adapter 1